MQHPEEGVIHAWLDGALPASAAAALESHVASCTECAAAVADARGLIAASSRIVGHLDAVPGKVIPVSAPRKRRLPSWRSPWVAAIAAGLILFVRGYLSGPTSDRVVELPRIPETPGVIRPAITDSMPIARPPIHVEPQVAKGPVEDSRRRRSRADSAISTSVPPANMAMQKSNVVAAQPAAAPVPAPVRAARTRETAARADAQSSERKLEAVVVTSTAGGIAAGARAAAAPPSASDRRLLSAADEAPQAFIGCYEMNASTDVLPARFALAADSSTIRGLQRVQYIDADGKPTSVIADIGWSIEGGQVVVKTQARETLLTLRKTGSTVAGESRSGSRNGRVTSCR